MLQVTLSLSPSFPSSVATMHPQHLGRVGYDEENQFGYLSLLARKSGYSSGFKTCAAELQPCRPLNRRLDADPCEGKGWV
jgi:hypothetical protein